MSLPELITVAEGDLPSGQHRILRAGGTREDLDTFLETAHLTLAHPLALAPTSRTRAHRSARALLLHR